MQGHKGDAFKKGSPLNPSQNFYVPPLTRRTKDKQRFLFPTVPQAAVRNFFEKEVWRGSGGTVRFSRCLAIPQ